MNNVLTVCPLFSNGAVIQRNRPISVWGTAAPFATVTCTFDQEVVQTQADNTGQWQLEFSPRPAGGPYELDCTSMLTVDQRESVCTEQSVHCSNILVGDVWILAGQSNMELWIGRVITRYPDVLDTATDSNIRVFAVPQVQDFVHKHDSIDSESHWQIVGRDDISGVSAIGYFFAQTLREHVDVPIGLVSTAIGGSHIEAWIDRGTLEHIGLLPDDFDRLTQPGYIELQTQRYASYEQQYNADLDAFDEGLSQLWMRRDFDDSHWEAFDPQYGTNPLLQASGSVWIRIHCAIDQQYVGKPCEIRLGTMIDADECFLNGELIGRTEYQYPPRNYRIDSLPQDCVFALRLKVYSGNGQLTQDKAHELVFDNGDRLNLDTLGQWRLARACSMPNRREQEFYSHMAVGNYNAMIAPISRLASSGVLWYQGESNADGDATVYGHLLCALVQCWRRTFGDPQLPFLVAQLPNFALATNCDWPRLRNEQLRVLDLDNTALIVTADCGEDNDLHPVNKLDVAQRFATAARAMVYGEDIESMGPIPVSATRTYDGVELRFIHVAESLRAQQPIEFTILEPAGHAYTRTAQISDIHPDRIVIPLSQEIGLTRGSVIRYDWRPSPSLKLWNSQGLPATPFELLIHC